MPTSSADTGSNGNTFQNAVYIGINLEDILYGIELILYFRTIHLLLTSKGARKKNIFYACFSTMMLFAVTVWVAVEAFFGERMWLLNRGFPGGPDAYWKANSSIWYMDWGTAVLILLQLMTDGLMIYRCRIVWDSFRVVIVPIVLWLATLVLGIMVNWLTSLPGSDFFSGAAARVGLAYYTVSVSLNSILTCMICYRIIRHGKVVQQQLGREYASTYFSIVTIVIESVFPSTLSGIAFLVSLGIGSPTSVVFGSIYVLLMCISPQALILRVIAGKAWEKDSFRSTHSSVKFSVGLTSTSLTLDGGTTVHLPTLSHAFQPDKV